jgi:hypothetical protein
MPKQNCATAGMYPGRLCSFGVLAEEAARFGFSGCALDAHSLPLS